MKIEDWNEGLNNIDFDLVEEFDLESARLEKKKKYKNIWLKLGAFAACFCIIIGGIITIPFFSNDAPDVPDVPTWDSALYSAQEIADMLMNQYYDNAVATNAYQKIYVPNSEYLNISSIPETECLGIYQYNSIPNPIDEDEFKDYMDTFIYKLADSLGLDVPQFEIEESTYEDALDIWTKMENYRFSAWQNKDSYFVSISNNSSPEQKIVLNGKTVQADQRLTDEEIIASLEPIKNTLFEIFGADFTNTKIIRRYDGYSQCGANNIYIYYYNESAHYLNSSMIVTDYICIGFDNFMNYSGDVVGDTVLSVAFIDYKKRRNVASDEYELIANAKKISLEEAESLLYNGYVFGGHSCPLCMEAQDKISFEGYDFVDLEYVFGYDKETYEKTVAIPFYAFYKKLDVTTSNGNSVYAKTYVPAIQVSGYKEYFESQAENHKDNSYTTTE